MKDELKKLYQSIPIPPELNSRVERALHSAKPRRLRCWQKGLAAFAACFCLFVVSINVSPALAASLYDLPVVGDFAMMFTFRETHQVDEAKDIVVRIPAIRGTGNSALEQQINGRIAEKMELLQAEATQMAQDYLDAYNATKQESDHDFWKVEIDIDYGVKLSTPDRISFVLTSTSSAANVFTQQYFYNIDLRTGNDLTLADLLGAHYKELCNKAVKEGIARRMADDPDAFYYTVGDDEPSDDEFAFQSISEDQPFYINAAGNPVIVFEKYEIAPGYMGIQEFEVTDR